MGCPTAEFDADVADFCVRAGGSRPRHDPVAELANRLVAALAGEGESTIPGLLDETVDE